ncbi:MAG: hypothetical protein E7Z64_07400 [Thermoplasmata archaeon]|nr:hypothetical protein [Thermoplasmata archaeon]
MSLFEKRTQVYGPESISIGEFDPAVDGFYRNVVTVPLAVKHNQMLYVKVTSDNPVDIVIARDNGSAVMHKDKQKDVQLGPFPTEKHDSMGVILGVFRGDKATATLEAWTERK